MDTRVEFALFEQAGRAAKSPVDNEDLGTAKAMDNDTDTLTIAERARERLEAHVAASEAQGDELLKKFEVRLENAAKAAEEARGKADSESGFASNAKQNAEEHAKAVAAVKGTVEADAGWLAATKKTVDEYAQAVNTAKNAAEIDVRAIGEAKASAERDSVATKAVSDRIAVAVVAAEQAQADMTRVVGEATSNGASIATAKNKVEELATAASTLHGQVVELSGGAKSNAASIAKSESDGKQLLASLAEVAVASKDTQERVVAYERKLTELITGFTEINTKIEGLLPNATSAGLASAFRNQQARFKKPQKGWLITFVVSIVLLLCAGLIGLPGFWPNATPETWDSIMRHFFARLPLVVPLVWLGIYAGRNYMLALQVEEEYAFKEAVSTSFEGYKRQMADISGSGNGVITPIVSLCESVLRTLSQRPGRIYEGKHDDITPFAPVAKTIAEATQNRPGESQART